ncbi:Multidrug resistance protein homolog 65 [Gryllus bimaculatus]|nr:Multidrug resistance protein homolog 65 [Gryllus bimaculatus]
MANISQKFGILLWKGLIVRKCHWFVTLLELCVPCLLFIGLASLNSHVANIIKGQSEQIYELEPEKSISLKNDYEKETLILYTPINNVTSKLMMMFKTDLLQDVAADIQGVSHESEMEKVFKHSYHNDSLSKRILGVVFLGDMTEIPLKSINYKIRSVGSPYSYASSSLYAGLFDAMSADQYKNNGFLLIQLKLNRCFFKLIGREMKSSLSLLKFPQLEMNTNEGKKIIHEFLPLATILSFIFLCPGVLKRIVEEKSTGVKELMKLMGVPSLILWFSWFAHAMGVAILSVTVITVIVVTPFSSTAPVMLCSGFVFWIFMILYCTASITFLFAISALFKKPTLAMVFGFLVWISSGIATKFVMDNQLAWYDIALSCLLPNIAVSWGYHAIFSYEVKDLTMYLGDVFNPATAMSGDFHLWQVWVLFVAQTVFYFTIAMYLEAIFPGDYGVAKPWYFPFMVCLNKCARVTPQSDMKGGSGHDPETFEPLAKSLPLGIKIRKLQKVFKSPWNRTTKVAVDDVSLDICKGQITALLGHNGAGKSTTMMILTGMLPPTSGTVEINGYNIKYYMSKVRESLGLCPQHNLLFPDLTVRQHLLFFAKLKSGPEQDPEKEVSVYAKKLNLISHLEKIPSELSGGYKRRLCLALAFIGQSETVILDEPTSGLDPEARREIWDLLLNEDDGNDDNDILQSMRGSRTILITTHIMEEADVLGDRIAIMDHGRVQCYGTPMYLKKLYGTGYVLSILKKSSSDPDKIETAIKAVIAEAELKTSVASLMTFSLPDEKRSLFPELFSLLQRERVPLGIESVGVSITTLEEVFLRVGEIALEESGKTEDLTSELSEKSECSLKPLSCENVKGTSLWLQQLQTLFWKRILVMNFSYLIQLVLVALVIIFVTTVSLHRFGGKPIPPLQLDLSLYGKTSVLYTSAAGTSEQLIANYKTSVMKSGSTVELVPPGANISSTLLKRGYQDKETYVFKYIVAGQLNRTDRELVALYSEMALHSLPISVNLLANALVKYETNDSEYSISVANHPFQKEEAIYLSTCNAQYIDGDLVTLLWMSLVPLVLTFWIGLFVIVPMEERVSSSRQLQCMAGVNVPTYWLTLYTSDLLLHLGLSSVLVIAIGCIDHLGVFNSLELGLIMVIIMAILHDFGIKAVDCLEAVIRLVPNFALTQVLHQFIYQVMEEKACLRTTKFDLERLCSSKDVFSRYEKCCSCVGDDCGTTSKSYMKSNQDLLLYLSFSWILYMAIVIILDMGMFEWLWEKVLSRFGSGDTAVTGNDDVDGEVQRVGKNFKEGTKDVTPDLLVNNLKKKYGILPKPLAVKGVSFQVKPGECFGLLGVNGAGKTTTFKMLTGAVVPTHGVASIAGYRSDEHRSQYLSQIGYCPQHDALIESLTANEVLKMYGSLRGVPKTKLNSEVEHWINMMGLREYRNKKCGMYSGGNKRKLMTAMALIGNPPLVFLDEPTSGVDPLSRRNLWNSLIMLQKTGQSIVLTSHSMEECEALCNRLGIMVGGQLKCMGNIPYLKNKYKQGSTIKIKLRAGGGEETIEKAKQKMESAFSTIILKDSHETFLHYQVTDRNVSWGYMFETMETLKKESEIIEDYTISETTLEEVFLSFAQT